MVRNVHERRVPASPEAVGELLDSLAGDADRLWSPRWTAMRFDRPLGVGADGGHGPIRYSVEAYEPGRRVVFRFAPRSGLDGTHMFEVEPADDGTALLRHVLEGKLHGGMRLLWPLAVRWMHDACVEDCLDQGERSLGVGPTAPARWSPWVRLLHLAEARDMVRNVAVPADVVAMSGLPRPDHSDAVVVTIPPGASTDVERWHDTVFSVAAMPGWLGTLFRIRGVLARALRLRTAELTPGDALFTPRGRTADTLVAGEDDKHLDFRVVMRVSISEKGDRELMLATVVQRHNAVGRAYFALIRPFHRRIVRALVGRALALAPAERHVAA